MFQSILDNVSRIHPLIHSITNYITANDCANILLACGASPIMADDPLEAAEITSLCSGLCLNLGTLNSRTIESMILSGKKANQKGIPVILDPVGAGASQFRTQTAFTLLSEIKFSVIRGNMSEIKSLALKTTSTKGVDAALADQITECRLEEAISFAKEFSRATGAVTVITGPIDLVSNETSAFCIRNGAPLMSSVTGTGCQLSALIAAFAAASPNRLLEATAAAVCAMGLAGETALKRMASQDGNASYRNYIIDAVFNMNPEILEKGARYEMR